MISCKKSDKKNSVKEVNTQKNEINNRIVNTKISYWTDKEYKVNNIDSIYVNLQIGFDELTTFNFFINDSLFKRTSCITNGSIGECILKTKELKFPEVYIVNKFNEGDSLKIITDSDIIKFKLNNSMKSYNELNISRYNDIWELGFVNSNRTTYLE